MIETLWLLLLPFAAVSGWLAAQRDRTWWGGRKRVDLPTAYFRGLNFLLNEETDKAIEVFSKVLEIDSDTVEIHMALGNLFRRRGEVEKATRIHQNLIARPSLDNYQRQQAMYELSRDYFKAGLLDRAESLLLQLNEKYSLNAKAGNNLLNIYEQEKEWRKAIFIAKQLSRKLRQDYSYLIAQYYCELAESALNSGEYPVVKQHLDQAFEANPDCVRATIQLGRLEAYVGENKKAVERWQRIGDINPKYLGEVINLIAENYRQLGDLPGLQVFLRDLVKKHQNFRAVLVLVELIIETKGHREAEIFLADWVRAHPSVSGLLRLIQIKFHSADENVQRDLSVLELLMKNILSQTQEYVCRQCGFSGKTMHWQCPGCKSWESIQAVEPEQLLVNFEEL